MWKWLFDAHRLLGVTVEVLDDQFEVLMPSRDGRVLRDRFENADGDTVTHRFAASVTRDTPSVATAGEVRLACAPILATGTIAGAVLVGTDASTHVADTDLLRLGSLLAEAVADQLARPANELRGNLHQISALYQLLHAAIATGSEREVLRTFAEALSIWEDIEVLAYRADLNGRYVLVMALPGSDRTAVPPTLAHEPMLEGPRVVRLSAEERDGIGFAGERDTILARLASDGGRWLIAMNSAPGTADGERSETYVAALGHALNGCLAVESSRLTWAIMQQFVDRDPPQDAARRALDEVCRALDATGTFSVVGADRSRLLMVGDHPIDQTSGPVLDARCLRSPVAVPPAFSAWLEIRSAPGCTFSPRDVKLFEAAVASFGAWLPAAVRRLGPGERRGIVRSFEQIVDRYVREAHVSQDPMSFILVSAGDQPLSIETTHAWIKRLRPQLRPTDLVGRLTSGELGVLLMQTPSAGAHVVARRLVRTLALLSSDEECRVTLGVATQRADCVSADALIALARQQPVDPPVASG